MYSLKLRKGRLKTEKKKNMWESTIQKELFNCDRELKLQKLAETTSNHVQLSKDKT